MALSKETHHVTSNEHVPLSGNTIRTADINDLDNIVSCAIAFEKTLQEIDPKRIVHSKEELREAYSKRILNSDPTHEYHIVVAEAEGRILGYAIGKAPRIKPNNFYVLFQGVYVTERARGKGIADLLSQDVLDFAKRLGAKSVQGEAYRGSLGDAYFGQKKGWEEIKEKSNLRTKRLALAL